jgi:hypothetical protein
VLFFYIVPDATRDCPGHYAKLSRTLHEIYYVDIYKANFEELNGATVSAFGVRLRKLSNVDHWMSDQKFNTSRSSVLQKARYAVGTGCICSL